MQIKRVANALTLIKAKEIQFMEGFKERSLGDIFDEYELWDESSDIANLIDRLKDDILDDFFIELLEDEEVLDLNICGHYKQSDGTEIFGLTLLDVYECPYCNDIHSDWYALVFDTETKKPRFGVCQCTDSESVEDSPFRGYPLSDIVGHIFDMGFIY